MVKEPVYCSPDLDSIKIVSITSTAASVVKVDSSDLKIETSDYALVDQIASLTIEIGNDDLKEKATLSVQINFESGPPGFDLAGYTI